MKIVIKERWESEVSPVYQVIEYPGDIVSPSTYVREDGSLYNEYVGQKGDGRWENLREYIRQNKELIAEEIKMLRMR